MLICVCNAIREKDFRQAVRDGAHRPGNAFARCGHRVKCGQCLSFAKSVIASERLPA